VDLVSTIGFDDTPSMARDTLGQVYEYFLGMFASAEGKRGGQFYTPASIVKTLVAILIPHSGKVYDPCCGSGCMFVQSEKFIEAHGGKLGDVSIYGQEANPTTWRLAAMNLAIRGIDFNLGKEPGDTFTRNQHPDLRADFILANHARHVADRLRRALRAHPVCGQAYEGPQPDAGDCPSQPRVPGQAGRAGGGLHRHRQRAEGRHEGVHPGQGLGPPDSGRAGGVQPGGGKDGRAAGHAARL